MLTMLAENSESVKTASIPSFETPINTPIERNKLLLKQYLEGIPVKQLAKLFNISEVRVYQLVGKNKHLLVINKEFEKQKRLARLKQIEAKTNPMLECKDASELVKVIEAQRKELEGDSTGQTSNTQININLTHVDLKSIPDNELWEKIRALGQSG